MAKLNAFGIVLCAGVWLCLSASGFGQDQPDDAPRVVDQITFSPALSGSVLQATGNRLRCDLISMTSEKVIVRNNQRTNEIEMDKVRSIRSMDGKFEFTPAQESFESLLRRCRRIQGVMLGKLEVYDDPQPAPRRSEDPANPETPQPGEQGSLVSVPPNGAGTGTSATDTQGANTAGSNDARPAVEGTTSTTTGTRSRISICANCGKEIPPTLKNGDRCPHCQVIFWDPNRPITPVSSGTGTSAGGNSGPNSTPAPSGTGAQYPTATGAGTTVAAPAPVAGAPTLTTRVEGMSLWMKVGLFVGMLGIVWLLFQRR